MTDLDAVLDANRAAVREFLATAERCEAVWRTPRAPGKWSPSQITEHVARSLEEGANEVAGAPSSFPKLPAFLRPLAKTLLFNRVIRNEAFPKARTSKPFDPEAGPATPAQARVRLEAALARLDQACRTRAATDEAIRTVSFGTVKLEDYAKFQGIHVRHHGKQLPVS